MKLYLFLFMYDQSAAPEGEHERELCLLALRGTMQIWIFLLFSRSVENAGDSINTMVSDVFCISESIENYAKIDVKT